MVQTIKFLQYPQNIGNTTVKITIPTTSLAKDKIAASMGEPIACKKIDTDFWIIVKAISNR